MTIAYSLTPELRQKLKEPIGMLIRGSFTETMKRFKKMVDEEKPLFVISVGDTVSKNLARSHVFPRLAIVDNKCMRRTVQEPTQLITEKIIHAKNPQATITTEAIEAIQEALKSDTHTTIVVDGEEDLLTLVAVLYAPNGSFVLYGQPYEGIVVVKVRSEKKAEIAELLKQMEIGSKS
ncbi:MAG TPA: DUF359 domain-containing protein [Candidatus Bathyarchaeia archaeon]|jgi:uncharacterized protein (UPF0218 family)|nr:DUF359 domain-containing protein [Candidatus Bathyarchaeia archaeon]